MMTSTRPRGDVGSNNYSGRRGPRGHANQLSISDPSHHVTEAIGTLYGDDDEDASDENRPVSFSASASKGGDQSDKHYKQPPEPAQDRLKLVRSTSEQKTPTLSSVADGHGDGVNGSNTLRKSQTLPARIPSQRSSSYEGPRSPVTPLSPTPSLRDVQADSSGSQFPLTNIDNPNDIAQELSNLQALRRMSMDVGNSSDPDLLPFSTMSLVAMPSVAPKGDDDEADPSRLLWVPARVHPELEPTAFKNFLENRVQTMKRRSGDSLLSVDGLQRQDSGSLRRKKSMLSRQVHTSHDSGDGYADIAERLQRQNSLGEHPVPELSLDELVRDPTKAVQRLAQEIRQEGGDDDMPVLPVGPNMGLRRSTRTQYRKGGSLRSGGDRAPFSKRVVGRQAEKDNEDAAPPVPPIEPAAGKGLTRVNSEPVSENYSRPRAVRRQQNYSREAPAAMPSTLDGTDLDGTKQDETENSGSPSSPPPSQSQNLPFRSASALAQRASAPTVPDIVETPPAEESSSQPARPFPQRSSSQKPSQQVQSEPPPAEGPPARSSKRPTPGRSTPSPSSGLSQPSGREQPTSDNLNEIANHASPIPGSSIMRTDSLTFIPTFTTPDDRSKKSKDKEDSESVMSSKSSSSGWKWFKSDDKEKKKREKEKEREREREKEKEEQAKRAKAKASEKNNDHARLDVLQTSIDTVVAKGRESLLLDRESIDNKLQEERKRESTRKVSDTKKVEGFFGGLFGGSKKKSDKEPGHKKNKDLRPLSPDPPPRVLRADVDYPWTRFPIIEERAIYRMAHIKLANPRRSLHSQVLLSNFMYSYLAKVQAMHPQLQVPISPQQKRQEEERKRREAELAQQQLLEQQQAAQQQQAGQDGNFDFEYHRSGNQYGDPQTEHGDGRVQYVDDSEIYEYEHRNDEHHDDGNSSPSASHQNGGGYQQARQGQQGDNESNSGQDYYYGRDNRDYDDDDENSDMW